MSYIGSHGISSGETKMLLNESSSVSQHQRSVAAVAFHIDEFAVHIASLLLMICVILFKSTYHRIHLVARVIPESLVLILIGACIGSCIRFGLGMDIDKTMWYLTPSLFFNFLLPPIVLESAYCLYNRTFGEYLGIILTYAVAGTVFNFLLVGFAMFCLEIIGAMGPILFPLDVKVYLLFASLIVAVDPVAVLAIFQDIGVDQSLYYMVFGESLLNDAVTVVLYMIMSAFCGYIVVEASQIAIGFVSFFTISVGGLLIGIVFGVLTCLVTRFHNSQEASTAVILGYLSYVAADLVGWSGIISMIGCGLMQAAYAFHNMETKSVIAVRTITEEAAVVSEAIIFIFIGVHLLNVNLIWNNGFCFWGLATCLIARAIVVTTLTAAINCVRADNRKISITEQIILIYGGLRGAVALTLALLIDKTTLGEHGNDVYNLIVTATLFIILVTVGFMGVTMKPLVKLLKIRMEGSKKVSLLETLNQSLLDHCLAGIEAISGCSGRNRVRMFFLDLDDRYIRRLLQRDPETKTSKLIRVYEKVALKLHYASVQRSKSSLHLDQLPELVKYQFYENDFKSSALFPLNVSLASVYTGHESIPSTSIFKLPDSSNDEDEEEIPIVNKKSRPNFQAVKHVAFIPGTRRQSDFHELLLLAMRHKARALSYAGDSGRLPLSHKGKKDDNFTKTAPHGASTHGPEQFSRLHAVASGSTSSQGSSIDG